MLLALLTTNLTDPNPGLEYGDYVQLLIKIKARYFDKNNESRENDKLMLAECGFKTIFIGDLHAGFKALLAYLCRYSDHDKPAWCKYRLVFLGDFVDRGNQSLKVMTVLFLLKELYPDNIYLVRGNHETMNINTHYGFKEHMLELFHDNGKEERDGEYIWGMFNEAFTYLPIGVCVGGLVLGVHGGIPRNVSDLELIRKIRKPIKDPLGNLEPGSPDQIVQDTIWADPALFLEYEQPNKSRGISYEFGYRALYNFMKETGLQQIVRAHQNFDKGFAFFCGLRLISIFGVPCYENGSNFGCPTVYDEYGRFWVDPMIFAQYKMTADNFKRYLAIANLAACFKKGDGANSHMTGSITEGRVKTEQSNTPRKGI